MKTREDVVKKLNLKHAMLSGIGKVKVMRFADDGKFTLESVFDLRAWYAPDTLTEYKKKTTGRGKNKKTVNVAFAFAFTPHPRRHGRNSQLNS